MTPAWRQSALGVVHWLEPGETGLTSRCGRWSPEAHDVRDADPSKPHCPRCVKLYGGRTVPNPLIDPEPVPGGKSNQRRAKVRNAAIRAAKAISPEISVRQLSERFGVSERVAWQACRWKGVTS